MDSGSQSAVGGEREPEWSKMFHPRNSIYLVGYGRTITAEGDPACASLLEFRGLRPEPVHRHAMTTEIYHVQPDSSPVDLFLEHQRCRVEPGEHVVIPPGTWHASCPLGAKAGHIIIEASPAFSEEDSEYHNSFPGVWPDS